MVKPRTYRTLYDVQQLLKEFNVFVYVGKRLYDIELMAIELDHLYEAGVVDNQTYMKAKLFFVRNTGKKNKERKMERQFKPLNERK